MTHNISAIGGVNGQRNVVIEICPSSFSLPNERNAGSTKTEVLCLAHWGQSHCKVGSEFLKTYVFSLNFHQEMAMGKLKFEKLE